MAVLSSAPLILDGGLATELEARGCDISGPLWSARVLRERPESIEQLHYDYYAAGASVAITASYQASYEGFASIGLDHAETTRLLQLSVNLAQKARARYRRDHPLDGRNLLVAASVGPYGAISHDGAEYRGDYGLEVAALIDFHAPRFAVLANAGADLLACETTPVLAEAQAYAELLNRHPRSSAWLSFTSHDGTRTCHGEPLAECARLADGVPNVLAVGVNCIAPELVPTAIDELKSGTQKPIVAYPNSGENWNAQSESWGGSPRREDPAVLAREWIRRGARLVGGCCRVGPAQITRIAIGAQPPEVRPAHERDLPEIRALLERDGLPVSDLERSRASFMTATAGATLLGAAGLEHHGDAGLLRSVVVATGCRGIGIGRALVEAIEADARRLGLIELVLLTESAHEFFAGLGYVEVERDRVSESLRRSAEFTSLCPRSARCMAKRIGG